MVGEQTAMAGWPSSVSASQKFFGGKLLLSIKQAMVTQRPCYVA
jgi:hypothetical protein